MKPIAIAIAAAAVLVSGCEKNPALRRADVMNTIDHQVRLPRGAAPRQTYARYYAWIEQDRRVAGVYVRGEMLGRRWVNRNHLPLVLQPGCSVITFTWDVAARRVERIACNQSLAGG